jgi:hypothetical protein
VRPTSCAICLFSFAHLVACNKTSSDAAPSASAVPVASVAPTPSPAPTPALPAALPADLDVAALKKKLACVGDTRRQSCRILNEFGEASRFSPQIPSGEGRWIGTAYTFEKNAEKSELMIVSASQVPTSTVAPNELALRVGIGPMPDDKRDHGAKLVNALSHGDTVSKLNQAAPYVKAWKPSDARGTMATSGTSVRTVTDEVYLRQSSTKIMLVRLKAAGAGSAGAEATLAELWPASW